MNFAFPNNKDINLFKKQKNYILIRTQQVKNKIRSEFSIQDNCSIFN